MFSKEELQGYAEGGMYRAEIAQMKGCKPDTVSKYATLHGVSLPHGRDSIVGFPSIKRAAEDLKPLDAVAFLLDVLKNLLEEGSDKCIWPNISLTRAERTICLILLAKGGAVVSKATLWEGLYAGRDGPDYDNIVTVHISNARKKLAGTGFNIVTSWGQGYRFERDPGTVFPWEQNPEPRGQSRRPSLSTCPQPSQARGAFSA